MPTKTKKKKTIRVDGKIRSLDDVTPAVFVSNFPNYQVTMDSYIAQRDKRHTGKRLDFSKNGQYETKDPDEIKFLKRHCKNCGPITKVKMIKDVQLKEEVKESE